MLNQSSLQHWQITPSDIIYIIFGFVSIYPFLQWENFIEFVIKIK